MYVWQSQSTDFSITPHILHALIVTLFNIWSRMLLCMFVYADGGQLHCVWSVYVEKWFDWLIYTNKCFACCYQRSSWFFKKYTSQCSGLWKMSYWIIWGPFLTWWWWWWVFMKIKPNLTHICCLIMHNICIFKTVPSFLCSPHFIAGAVQAVQFASWWRYPSQCFM